MASILMRRLISLLLTGYAVFLFSEENVEDDHEEVTILSRSEAIPLESVDNVPDPYFEGYLQALVDMHYYEYKVIVLVKDHVVWLANLPKNKLLANSIISFISDVPGVKEVKVLDGVPPKDTAMREKYVNRPRINGIWFPQSTELFLPLIANPRQIIYSIGYRIGDHVVGKNAVAVSLGDDFPIYRWLDVWRWHGDLQVGIEAGIWSVFNIDVKSPNIAGGAELVNTDFSVGIPITYAVNKWAWRLRLYHISSHLGDEFMLNHPNFQRVNPSFEALDLFFSFQATGIFRLYGGAGVILESDPSFPLKYFYFQYGTEIRFLKTTMPSHRLYGNVFLAAHFQHWQRWKYEIDQTYVAGYEWSKLQGIGRKIRIMGEFHHGFSMEGQFFRERTTYGGIKLAYGF